MTAIKPTEEKQYRVLKCDLTDDELREKGQDIARLIREHAELKSALESITADYKAKMKSNALEVALLSRAVNDRHEYRDVEVREMKNYIDGKVEVIRVDTLETIESRAMTAKEAQGELFSKMAERIAEEVKAEAEKAATDKSELDLASPEVTSKPAEIDEAEAEEMYRAYDGMRRQMLALQEKARNPRDEDEARYIDKMIDETRDGLAETERDWAAFVASNKERAEAIHRRLSSEHEAFDRERMEEMVKDIRANKKLSFAALARLGYDMNFVLQAEAAGLIYRKTNLSKFELGPMPPKESANKAEVPIAESGDVVEADPLDLVPDDWQARTWEELSEAELSEWYKRLIGARGVDVLRMERVKAEMDRRDDLFSKFENEGEKSDVQASAKKTARKSKKGQAGKAATQ